jgi:4-hydroxybenzoate polyprenyltransferase
MAESESFPLGVACPNPDSFPCNAGALEAISLAVAAGGAGLCMSLFLTKRVGHRFLLCMCVCVCACVYSYTFDRMPLTHSLTHCFYILVKCIPPWQ